MLKKWKRRWLPYLIAYSAKISMRLLLCTCRVRIRGLDAFTETAKNSPCILMLWHNRLVVVSEILNAYTSRFVYTAFISKSRDGDPLARLAESYSRGKALRVPHNARHRALHQMIGALKEKKEIVLITPDGPRGPRHVVKPGIIVAAKEAKAQIVPFSWQAKRFWQLNTWDQMKIPKPFTTVNIAFGPAIALQGSEEDFEKEACLLKTALESLERELCFD